MSGSPKGEDHRERPRDCGEIAVPRIRLVKKATLASMGPYDDAKTVSHLWGIQDPRATNFLLADRAKNKLRFVHRCHTILHFLFVTSQSSVLSAR